MTVKAKEFKSLVVCAECVNVSDEIRKRREVVICDICNFSREQYGTLTFFGKGIGLIEMGDALMILDKLAKDVLRENIKLRQQVRRLQMNKPGSFCGHEVRLKSGSPDLTVTGDNGETVAVEWADDRGEIHSDVFPRVCVEPISSASEPVIAPQPTPPARPLAAHYTPRSIQRATPQPTPEPPPIDRQVAEGSWEEFRVRQLKKAIADAQAELNELVPVAVVKTLEELAALQGVKPCDDSSTLAGGFQEDEDVDVFLAYIHGSSEAAPQGVGKLSPEPTPNSGISSHRKERQPSKLEVSGSSPESPTTFHEGYLLGKVEVYCEQVRAGAKLAGELSFDDQLLPFVSDIVAREGLGFVAEQSSAGRATVWIYNYPFVEVLVRAFISKTGTPSLIDMFAAGKLFGYSDLEVIRFLGKQNGIQQETPIQPTTSASDEIEAAKSAFSTQSQSPTSERSQDSRAALSTDKPWDKYMRGHGRDEYGLPPKGVEGVGQTARELAAATGLEFKRSAEDWARLLNQTLTLRAELQQARGLQRVAETELATYKARYGELYD